jgi:MFS family permease
MNWNELQQFWQTQRPVVTPQAWDPADYERQRARLARTLARRDWLEAGVGLAVAIFFAVALVPLGSAAWPGWVSVVLLLAMSAFFVRERRRSRRTTPPPEAPLIVRLEADIAELRHQCRMLNTVALWYVLPILLAIVLLFWGVRSAMPAPLPPLWSWRLLFFTLGTLGFAAFIIWVNRVAVRTSLEPRLRELDSIRISLKIEP